MRFETLIHAVDRFISFIILVLIALMASSELGADIGSVLVSVGLASLALGFAAQNIIRDYLHGFLS